MALTQLFSAFVFPIGVAQERQVNSSTGLAKAGKSGGPDPSVDMNCGFNRETSGNKQGVVEHVVKPFASVAILL